MAYTVTSEAAPTETTIRARLKQIIAELSTVPAINATLVTREYAKRHGIDGRIAGIAAALLGEMFDPVVRALASSATRSGPTGWPRSRTPSWPGSAHDTGYRLPQ